MGKDNELLQMVKLEDVPGLTRLLHKFRATKLKLLGSGRRININAQDSDGISALHQAALMGSVDILTLLLESGAAADIKDNKGLRPLHYASWQGQSNLVRSLLQWGSSVNECAEEGETPLHLACQHGHLEVASHLLFYHANPSLHNKQHKSPIDLACEFGRLQVVEMLLSSNKCSLILEESSEDMLDNDRTTCLHLAAKNGHVDIIRLLLKYGMDINRSTLRGTCLHEAALHGRFEVVKLLLESGVDANKPNSYDQTALDIVKKITVSRGGREMKQMLKEAVTAVQAQAVKDYHNPSDPWALSFREGNRITILEQKEDGRWRGVIFGENYTSRSGYFPSTAVVLLDRPVGGMQRSKPPQMKKVAPPVVPEVAANRNSNSGRNSPFSVATTTTTTTSNLRTTSGGGNNINMDDNYPPPPSPLGLTAATTISRDVCDNAVYITSNSNCPSSASPVHLYPPYPFPGPQHLNHVLLPNRPVVGSNVIAAFSQPNSPLPGEDTYNTGYLLEKYPPTYQQQTSLEDQGIDVQSPGRDSPGSSGSSSGSGCRHSITSLDSGRASSSAYDGRSGHVYLAGPNQHRLSGHSYESSTSLRQSYHSSSSSLGSMDRLDEGSGSSTGATYSSAQINVSKLLNEGVSESEVLRRWLVEHRFEEYFHLFVQAGYDIPTISRMTPEDLVAIGITKPSHRKTLKAEIGKLNISDGLPDFIPATLGEWLQLLRLEVYYECLVQQGHKTVDDVLGIAWEDLEEVGIQKLGHQKKIMLAIKRVKDIQSGVKRFSTSAENRTVLEVKCRIIPPPNVTGPSYQSYMHGQEVAITCPNTNHLNSPSSENLPDFRTFHHPPAEAVEYVPCGAYGPCSPSHIIYRPDIVAIQVRHPSGARSLENLEDGQENRHRTFLQVDTRWNSTTTGSLERTTMSGVMGSSPGSPAVPASGTSGLQLGTSGVWRRGSFDDGDLTPTNEGIVHEMEGGGTLPRPKVSIKPRPVAKIMAKTRLPAGDGDVSVRSVNECTDLEKTKGNEGGLTSGRSDLHSSPRRSLPGSPFNSILRGKKVPPPPPPKRSNSIKGERKGDKSRVNGNDNCGDYSNEQLFASCVKSIASKFGLSRKNEWNSHESNSSSSANVQSSPCKSSTGNKNVKTITTTVAMVNNSTDNEANSSRPSSKTSDEILDEAPDRTPPSPAPGSPVHMRRDPSMCSSGGGGMQSNSGSVSPDSSCSPVFHACKRNESTSSFDSNGSTSSTESNLPFANENVGTIKQRINKPHPSITTLDLACSPRGSPVLPAKNGTLSVTRSAPATPKRRSSLTTERPPNSTLVELQETDHADDLIKPYRPQETGDVLSDIDNMLANLTEELDAMLTSDLQAQ